MTRPELPFPPPTLAELLRLALDGLVPHGAGLSALLDRMERAK